MTGAEVDAHEPARIRVVIVDDHEIVRSGLATFLRVVHDLELVGEAGNGEDGVRMCERVQPDVVLMDMVMPGMDGVAATTALREKCPRARVIALTSFPRKTWSSARSRPEPRVPAQERELL